MTFAEEIEANKSATVVSDRVASLETPASRLEVRLRGAFITKCELTSPASGRRVGVLFSDSDITKAKISATHPMMPAGPYEGIGGQHGFARWADYEERQIEEDGLLLRATRSDNGVGLSKKFVLSEGVLSTATSITNPGAADEHTSLGEHMYFDLAEDKMDGLKLNGKSLDELLGEGREADLRKGETLYFGLDSAAVISFPAGHSVKLSASFEGDSKYPLALWIWKRAGSPSICFEPVAGVKRVSGDDNRGLTLRPGETAELRTRIELL